MGAVKEVEASLMQQTKRHVFLQSIIKQIEDLRKTDEEGAE